MEDNMFNIEKETNNIIEFIKDYYKKNNLKGAVLGLSGGKDSAVVAALLSHAIGSENIIGVTLPCHSKEQDKKDAKIVSDYYNIKLYNLDLTNIYNLFKEGFTKEFNSDTLKDSDINIKPRLRMTTLYYIAQSLPGYLVVGTSNLSESYVGYFTKGGDNVCDISPLGNLTVSEVIKIGEYLNVPKEVLYKAPSDGISSQTDEEKLGVTYDEIEKHLNGEDTPNKEKILRLHNSSRHKFNIPTYKKTN